MNPILIPVIIIIAATTAGQPTQDTGAARSALLAPQGHNVTLTCGQHVFPPFGVKVAERDGKLVAKFRGCEKELRETEAGVYQGEYCSSQPFQWVYQAGDTQSTFKGSGGRRCSVALAQK